MPTARGAHASARVYTGSIRRSTPGERAPTAAERARERPARLLAEPHPAPGALEYARRGLAAALLGLRTTAGAASGEWWRRALPEERVVASEQRGHRTLAATVRRQELLPDRGNPLARDAHASTEDARP
jgi:hypothetical protein